MVNDILELADVRTFFNDLIDEGVNAHPDEDFLNYINISTGQATYSVQEAEVRNILMHKAFDVCKRQGADIYDLMQEIYVERSYS